MVLPINPMQGPPGGRLSGVLGSELSSLWDGLSPHLIARLYEVDIKGKPIPGAPVVRAPFGDDVQLDVDLNWQSPFENAGAEGAVPALSQMLQSGALPALTDKLGQTVGLDTSGPSGVTAEAIGRSGMTKLNSTQIFNGMPPLRIQGELLLRAWISPENEVERLLDQLMQWALPKHLAPEGTMVTAAAEYAATDKTLIESMLPSEVPSLLALTYKGRTYAPMVIERIGVPLGSPVDKTGRFTQLRLPITLGTLTAKDRNDWMNMKGVRF
ncbi:hypothetical protein PU634_05140 [Oceanimonas pelagia]|uniref:Uncharacterized protein n=1 Tax=Oceanimonas pelagia TaxID=3028314 RepID=A0AA50QB69_9GAMM|nr:hypothetical protein [Oceanimonas pelagia]WMC11753.1 hypothetical protein PU634_05140 [Oceanimonas pelagia]